MTSSTLHVVRTARVPAQRAAAPVQRSCYLPHCGAPAELRVVVSGMDWYRCTGCGVEYPEIAYSQRPAGA
ncbi:hypothetical protein WDV85_03615 [Pseudokineococcus sp. 5B2Z-1]|uniref:hypothetical protein n=1 Tax=Pseudokineococcus sp. 5B2Z-1 TaxID=3132744 RepID=UPI00260DFE6A|nr:hypothetical protein [uncultured Pseudokineococcus sp.]